MPPFAFGFAVPRFHRPILSFALGDLSEDIQLTVNSKGDYLIKTWLDKNLEAKIQALVLQQHIESKTLSVKDEWIDWKDF